jgi:hypothetical protein
MKARRLSGSLKRDRALLDAGSAEIISETSDRDHQRVISKGAQRRNVLSVVIDKRGDEDFAPLPVESDHLAHAVPKPMPMRLREIVGRVQVEVHAAGGNLMQVRLPEMGARFLDERDRRAPSFSQLVA